MYFSKSPIPMSLTELEPVLNKEATQLFKCLLMYSGERPNSYPPAMALQVLQAGVAQPDLRAEIYMQLILMAWFRKHREDRHRIISFDDLETLEKHLAS